MNSKAIVEKTGTVLHTTVDWILSILSFLSALVAFSDKDYYSGSVFIFCGLLLFPSIKNFILKIPVLNNTGLRYTIFGFCCIGAFILFSGESKTLSTSVLADNKETLSRGVEPADGEPKNADSLGFGKYFALIIGESVYDSKSLHQLKKPVEDATDFYKLIKDKYQFDSVKLLTNATKSDIMKSFVKLRSLLHPNDNILVFYAGHGYEDNSSKQGYWLPKNAEIDDPSNWISNSDIIDQINAIPSKHKLIISDACFSGGIFTARGANFDDANKSTQELYSSASCTAMTSGARTEVPDESVFMKYLLSSLQENTSKYKAARNLFYSFADNATSSNKVKGLIPQYGPILNTENKGGDFIFIKR